MKRLDSLLKNTAVESFSIYGYADFLGTDQYNDDLSKKRANAVRQYLLRSGKISASKIILVSGRGEKESAPTESTDGDAFSRRVDVWFQSENRGHEKPAKKVDQTVKNTVSAIANANAGTQLKVEGLNFIAGRHTVTPESTRILRELLQTMKENPALKIEIQGHICCITDQDDGYDYDSGDRLLSTNRAKAVYDFLVQGGIDPARLSYKGFGRKKPLVKEHSPEDEQINRRVEIKILSR